MNREFDAYVIRTMESGVYTLDEACDMAEIYIKELMKR